MDIDRIALSSPPTSPPAIFRKPVFRRSIQQPPTLPGNDSAISLVDVEHSHLELEGLSPDSSRQNLISNEFREARTIKAGQVFTGSHDISDQGSIEQDELESARLSEHCKKAKHGHHRWRDYLRKFWFWEVAACMLSFICFGSILLVLLFEDNRPLDTWGLFIPPPATISFIGTLAKTSLVLVLAQILSQLKWLHFQDGDGQPLDQLKTMDSASRGPLGSIFVLLQNTRNCLASFAACLMILTILLDPFVQLVFTFPTKPVVEFGQLATFKRMRNLPDTEFLHRGPSVRSWLALQQGFMNDSITPEIDYPSGNCIWSNPVKTLGLCGSCSKTNVTKLCMPAENYGFMDASICIYTFGDVTLKSHSGSTYPVLTSLNHRITDPTGFVYGTGTYWNATSYMGSDRVYKDPPLSSNTTFKSSTAGTLQYAGNGALIEFAAVQILTENTADASESNAIPDPPTRIWICGLNWCEKTFENIQVIGNRLTFTVSEKPLWDFASTGLDPIFLKHGVLPEDIDPSAKSVSTDYSYDDMYWDWLLTIFSSYYVDPDDTISITDNDATDLSTNPAMLASLLDEDDLNITMNRIAMSLSELIRTHDGYEEIPGTVQVMKSFIEVRWEWLALPIAVLFMTVILLVIVARKSYHSGVSLWKDDPIALLFHRIAGLEVDGSEETGPDNLRKLTKGVYVKLSSDEALTFVECTEKQKQN